MSLCPSLGYFHILRWTIFARSITLNFYYSNNLFPRKVSGVTPRTDSAVRLRRAWLWLAKYRAENEGVIPRKTLKRFGFVSSPLAFLSNVWILSRFAFSNQKMQKLLEISYWKKLKWCKMTIPIFESNFISS